MLAGEVQRALPALISVDAPGGDDFFPISSLRFRDLDEFAHLSNLSLKIRTDSCCFFAVNHPGPSETPLALPAALGGWFYADKRHKTPSKLPRVSLRTPPNSLNNIPQKVLNLRS